MSIARLNGLATLPVGLVKQPVMLASVHSGPRRDGSPFCTAPSWTSVPGERLSTDRKRGSCPLTDT
jgi:hypothetical protein